MFSSISLNAVSNRTASPRTASAAAAARALSPRTLITVFFSLLALAVLGPAAASQAAPKVGAVVFSQVTTNSEKVEEGGLYAIKDGHLNQLTEDPADIEPAFSPDGRTIAFAREGHIYSVRPDGSGQRRLTSGAAIDSAPRISPNGKVVVFERRTEVGGPADLFTVGASGGGLHRLTSGVEDDSEATFSPEGNTIVFVRGTASGGRVKDDLYSIRPNGSGLARLTTTANVDEFAPHYFAGGIVFSRGDDSETAAAFADIYTMRRNGTRITPLVRGVGSAYVEDVSPQGHTLIFRRDQGLWVKRIGPPKAVKLTELPDGSKTNSVFSSDGRHVAAFIENSEVDQLMSIDVSTGRKTELADSFQNESGSEIGPVIDWQPVR
jgi:dipeptidyl aminopeptidase/acylaminoacyl peptidase